MAILSHYTKGQVSGSYDDILMTGYSSHLSAESYENQPGSHHCRGGVLRLIFHLVENGSIVGYNVALMDQIP